MYDLNISQGERTQSHHNLITEECLVRTLQGRRDWFPLNQRNQVSWKLTNQLHGLHHQPSTLKEILHIRCISGCWQHFEAQTAHMWSLRCPWCTYCKTSCRKNSHHDSRYFAQENYLHVLNAGETERAFRHYYMSANMQSPLNTESTQKQKAVNTNQDLTSAQTSTG